MQRLSRRHIVLAALLVASAVFLLYSIRSMPSKAARGSAEDAPAADQAAAAERTLEPAAPADVDFSRYASLARTNIFSDQRSQPPPKPPKAAPPKSLPPLPGSDSPKPQRKLDLSGWNYLGYVEVDGKKLGLLAKDATETCEFVAVGETFMGAKVEDLDRDDIRLRSGASQTTLSRPRDFPLTPLTAAGAGGPQRPVRGAG